MQHYMIEFKVIGDPKSKEFQNLLPAEREKVKELMESGDMKHIWFKADFSGGYFVAYQKDEVALKALLDCLPLKDFLHFDFCLLAD